MITTLADKKSNDTILNRLSHSAIPVLSEEGKNVPYEERKSWNYLWNS